MINLLKNSFYKIMNGVYMNDKYAPKLDIILIYMNNIGIKSITLVENEHWIDVEFNDGTILHGWNANRWYAWLSQGNIKFSNGQSMKWYDYRPSHEIIYKLRKIVMKYEKELKRQRYEEDTDFSKYLPKGYAKRMERLKKLEEIEKHT